MILFGENAVRTATAEFMAHYDRERSHQGLDNTLICLEPERADGEGRTASVGTSRGAAELLLQLPENHSEP